MENGASELETESASGPSAAAISSEETNTDQENKNELGDFTVDTVTACQTQPQTTGIAAQATEPKIEMASKENQISLNGMTNKDYEGSVCNVKLDKLLLLKDSTKKLLCLIDELQVKSTPARPIPSAYSQDDLTIPVLQELTAHLEDLPETSSIAKLQNYIKEIDEANLENVHECSIYERLIRKCNCLNRKEYTDFIIHFNEDTKYATSNIGEIIKNIRILKKFVYMGGTYSKNALMFLNEGLTKCPQTEKIDIILAISHADICNVFDDDSFIRVLIKYPIQYETFGDTVTQNLAARVLYRIAIIEEGRRYLNFNSKISNDIKLILQNHPKSFNDDTKEFLSSTLNLLNPSTAPLINANLTYYCKASEGMEKKILNALLNFRQLMTLQEVFSNLALLNKLCDNSTSVSEMRQNLKKTCTLFKRLLLQYDNSDMNAILTGILNKVIKETPAPTAFVDTAKTFVVTDTATEPTEMKNELNQVQTALIDFKKVKPKLGIGCINSRHCSRGRKRLHDTTVMKSHHFSENSKPKPDDIKSNIIRKVSKRMSRKDTELSKGVPPPVYAPSKATNNKVSN